MTDPIEGIDYFVRIIPFPANCDGAVMLNDDGTYSVYINANTSVAMQYNALQHEINHIKNDDMYSDKSIIEIEQLS